jgi:hypothetical protein
MIGTGIGRRRAVVITTETVETGTVMTGGDSVHTQSFAHGWGPDWRHVFARFSYKQSPKCKSSM